MAVPAAIIGGSVIGGGLGLAGGKGQASAAKSAARSQLEAAKIQADALRAEGADSRKFLGQQAEIARADLAPFRKIGLDAYQQAYGLAGQDSAFLRDQGGKAIANRLSSQGLLRSNAFGSNLSNLESQLNQNKFNQFASLAGAGSGAAAGQAQISQGLGQNVAQSQMQGAGNIASLYQGAQQQAGSLGLAAAQAQAQGLMGIGNAANAGIGNALQFYYMNKLYPSSASGGAS